MDIPCYPAEVATAVPADQPFGQGIFAGKPATIGFGLLGIGRFFTSSPGEFFLNFKKHFSWDDSRVIVFDVVLREFAVIFLYLSFQKIGGVGFLQ